MADVGVLDLSAKPMPPAAKTVPSPTPSTSSSTGAGGDLHDERPLSIPNRPASISSDGHDTDSSTGTGSSKPRFPLPPLALPGMPPLMSLPGAESFGDLERGTNGASKGIDRKPSLESMASMFPQLAQAQAAAAAGLFPPGMGGPGGLPSSPLGLPGGNLSSMAGMGTLGGMGGVAPLGLMDTSAISLSSPITQYLQQKRRRSEARTASVTSSTSTSPVHSEAASPVMSTSTPVPSSLSPTSISLPNSRNNTSLTSSSGVPTTSPYDHGSPAAYGNHEPEPKRQKTDNDPSIEERRDHAYWDRRRKNNEAAKRSRDARRAKEEEIALRAAFLEQENLKLRAQVAILKNETAKLHYMLYNRS